MTEATEKKKRAGAKAGRKATKGAKAIKAKRAGKKLGDAALLTMAADLPAGGAKSLMQITHAIDKLEDNRKQVNLAIREQRAKLKEMKIELGVYDHVRRMRKMEPEDARAFKATEALYTESLGLELSPQQSLQIDAIHKRRADAQEALEDIHGADSGKEVGSTAAGSLIGHNSNDPAMPERNDDVAAEHLTAEGA